MAFGIYIEFGSSMDVAVIHARLSQMSKGWTEIFPIEEDGIVCGVGISISSKKLGNPLWWEIKSILSYFLSLHNCRIFEMYGGTEIDSSSLPRLKELIGT